jgi:hypothetical protein
MLLSTWEGFVVRRLDAIYVRLCNRLIAVSGRGGLLSAGTVYVAMPPSDGIQTADRERPRVVRLGEVVVEGGVHD